MEEEEKPNKEESLTEEGQPNEEEKPSQEEKPKAEKPKKGKRKYYYPNPSKAVPNQEIKSLLDYQITARFVEEVHRLEEDGRVLSREKLEEDLFVGRHSIREMRSGVVKVHVSSLLRLKTLYNGDFQFILLGKRDLEHSGPRQGGKTLNIHKPYTFPYRSEPKLNGIIQDLISKIDNKFSTDDPPLR